MIWIAFLGLYILPIIIVLTGLYIVAKPGESLYDVLYEEDLEEIIWLIFVPLFNYILLCEHLANHISFEKILKKFVKSKKKK